MRRLNLSGKVTSQDIVAHIEAPDIGGAYPGYRPGATRQGGRDFGTLAGSGPGALSMTQDLAELALERGFQESRRSGGNRVGEAEKRRKRRKGLHSSKDQN